MCLYCTTGSRILGDWMSTDRNYIINTHSIVSAIRYSEYSGDMYLLHEWYHHGLYWRFNTCYRHWTLQFASANRFNCNEATRMQPCEIGRWLMYCDYFYIHVDRKRSSYRYDGTHRFCCTSWIGEGRCT